MLMNTFYRLLMMYQQHLMKLHFLFLVKRTKPWGLDFNNDGTKMFITGATGGGTGAEDINEYSLNVGFDLSAGVNFVQLKTLADIGLRDPEKEPFGIEFNPDGTTMFIIGTFGNDVLQYALSTGFDVSTISFVGGLHLHGEESNPSWYCI